MFKKLCHPANDSPSPHKEELYTRWDNSCILHLLQSFCIMSVLFISLPSFFFFAIILIIYSSLQDKVNICKYTSKLALDFERWPNFSSHRLCFASLFIARSYVSYFVYHVHLTRCEISGKIVEFCSLLKTCFNLQMYKFSIHVSKLTISRVLFFCIRLE